jgi:hypothetical protein
LEPHKRDYLEEAEERVNEMEDEDEVHEEIPWYYELDDNCH